MKKVQIVLLVLIAAAIAILISFLKGSPTYDTVADAKSKPGKSVSLIGKLDKSQRLVLKGAIKDNHFECKEILMKCPSKYKDEMKVTDKTLPSAMVSPAEKTPQPKY